MSDEIAVRVDLSSVMAFLQAAEREYPKANAYVLNLTAEKALAEARAKIGARFVVRVPWTLPPARLPAEWKARSDNQRILISLGYGATKSSGGDRRRNMLGKFERGGDKAAKQDDMPIAIPTKALRPNPQSRVAIAMYPRSLRLADRITKQGDILAKKTRTLRSGGAVGAGKRGAFELNPAHMHGLSQRAWGIYQRFGPGRNDVSMIWAYRRRIPIPRRLSFHSDVALVVTTFLLPRLEEEYVKRAARGATA